MLPWKRNIKIPLLEIKESSGSFSMGLRLVRLLSTIKPTDVFSFLKFPYHNKLSRERFGHHTHKGEYYSETCIIGHPWDTH